MGRKETQAGHYLRGGGTDASRQHVVLCDTEMKLHQSKSDEQDIGIDNVVVVRDTEHATDDIAVARPITAVADMRQAPDPLRTAGDIGGVYHKACRTNGDGACALHALWGVTGPGIVNHAHKELSGGERVRSHVLGPMPLHTSEFERRFRGQLLGPLVDLVDTKCADAFNHDVVGFEKEEFWKQLPVQAREALQRHQEQKLQQDANREELARQLRDFTARLFTATLEESVVRPLCLALDFVRTLDVNYLALDVHDARCHDLEGAAGDLQLLHPYCQGGAATKYQVLFRPELAQQSHTDFRAAFMHHASPDVLDIVAENLADHSHIAMLREGARLCRNMHKAAVVTTTRPAECTLDVGWQALRNAMMAHNYWLSPLELKFVAAWHECRVSVFLWRPDASPQLQEQPDPWYADIPELATHVKVAFEGFGPNRAGGHFVRLLSAAEWQTLRG